MKCHCAWSKSMSVLFIVTLHKYVHMRVSVTYTYINL